MIQQESRVVIVDNSGAKTGKVIRVLKGTNSKSASVGDKVVIAIKTTQATSNIDKGSVQRAVVVRVRKEIGRKDGTYIRFSDNAVVLISKTLDPLGKRVFGPVAKEIREKFRRIATMADEVI